MRHLDGSTDERSDAIRVDRLNAYKCLRTVSIADRTRAENGPKRFECVKEEHKKGRFDTIDEDTSWVVSEPRSQKKTVGKKEKEQIIKFSTIKYIYL